MTAYRKTGRFLAAEDDLVFIYQFAYELESNRRFVQFQTAFFCNSIDQVRRRNAPSNSVRPTAALRKIICQHRDQLVRCYERSVAVNDPESVGIAVCGDAKLQISISNGI